MTSDDIWPNSLEILQPFPQVQHVSTCFNTAERVLGGGQIPFHILPGRPSAEIRSRTTNCGNLRKSVDDCGIPRYT